VLRRPATIDHYSKTKRYQSIKENLNERVETPNFVGYWVCKPSFTDAPPATSDVVILYIHGGGYVNTHPTLFATLHLGIAETIQAAGKTVSIFALEYSLAPEFPFPTQVSQTAACYQYLIQEANIPAEKIALMGDSAGGSIALSFFTHLHTPIPSVEFAKGLAKPGKGVFLLSPWVSLFNTTGYAQREGSDLLTIEVLDRWAKFAQGNTPKEQFLLYTDFLTAYPERGSWSEFLPANIWLSAGEDEVFLENITEFAKLLKEGNIDVTLDVKKGEAHDWQLSEAIGGEQEQLAGEIGAKGVSSGADQLGKAVLAVLN
jgi:acetyl esterase/lipase